MDNNNGEHKQRSSAPRGGRPASKGGYRGGKPGSSKGNFRGSKPSGKGRGGKPGFSPKGEDRGGSDFKKRNGHGSKPRYGKGDKPFNKDEHRSKRNFGDDRRSGDRAADGSYKGSYRGGDRNRRSEKRGFEGRNRSDRGYKGGNRSFEDRRQSPRAKEGTGSDQRTPNGFAGFDRGSLGGTKSLGYRAGQGKKKRSFTKATPARLLTHEVLTYIREEGCYLSEGVDKFITYSDKPVKERAFARLLATEVVARKGSLDEMIDSVLTNPEELEPDVRDALRMAFCEIFYLKKPDHVTVDQGVEVVRSFAPQAKGLANFALHRAVEMKDQFPFGDIETSPKAAALSEGFPLWLAERLIKELGHDEALRFMQRSNNPAPLFFMLNLACVDGPKALSEMVQRQVKIVPVSKSIDLPLAFPVFGFAERTAVTDEYIAKLLTDGGLVISDVAAQCIASLAMPENKPERFLEIGAGRGTKTILLQNAALTRFGEQIQLDTLDMDVQRTEERKVQLAKANINQSEVFVKDATNLSSFDSNSYDAVFVDAPCSGIGTLRRHPDIRWRMNEDDVASLAAMGEKMILEAARLVKVGGQLTFATCTVLSQENQQVIDSFLESEVGSGFEVVRTVSTDALSREKVTGPIYDAHFACVLKRVK